MGKKLGIDLGTTYSCVSYIDEDGQLRTINSSEGTQTTPSVVYLDASNDNMVIGAAARQEGAMNPDFMIERAKNFMGQDYTFELGDKKYSPTAVSAAILKQLINDAEEHLGDEEIEGVVITCPAYFKDAARNATRTAGESVTLKNGNPLNVLQILDEPVAAALAYCAHLNEDVSKTVLVYDLGGGTFDVTIVKIDIAGNDKKIKIITTGGDHQLGGKDWDELLKEYVIGEFCSATGTDMDELRGDADMRVWFSENIEKAKIMLTKKDSTVLTVQFNGEKEKIEITREKFDEVTAEKLQMTINLIDLTLSEKQMSMADIDEILLVGSSTKMPQVEARLVAEYGKPVNKYEQDKAVSMGAAYIANGFVVDQDGEVSTDETPVIQQKNGVNIVFTQACTASFGLLATMGDQEIVANIILKDTEKPASQTQRFVTSAPNQTSLTLRVFENDVRDQVAPVVEEQEVFETCYVQLEPGLPDSAPIDITFNISADGIIEIVATDVTRGASTTVVAVRKNSQAGEEGLDDIKSMKLG
jgi:molecular chaperone DnaK (HSP70)